MMNIDRQLDDLASEMHIFGGVWLRAGHGYARNQIAQFVKPNGSDEGCYSEGCYAERLTSASN